MKPSVGRWVHWNQPNEVVLAALIVECKFLDAEYRRRIESVMSPSELDFDVTLEVHGVARYPGDVAGGPTIGPYTRIIEHARFSPARSGHSTAVEYWTWPPREP